MKKITTVLIIIALVICSTICVSSDSTIGNTYQIENVTVIFESDSQFSIEQQERISELLVHPENGVAKANLICNIFGHKNTQEGVTAITHKVLEESPRCLEEFFTITNCSRCDQTTVERDGYAYISCCPED